MALDLRLDTTFLGPAFPPPFVRDELETELHKRRLLRKSTGADGQKLAEDWELFRRRLRELVSQGGALRVRHHVVEPLLTPLGYERCEDAPEVTTREGREPAGILLHGPSTSPLRVWTTDFAEDLDAPDRRGRAYRFSHVRIAQRVLRAVGERAGLVTNGLELRLLLCDPARPDSQILFSLDPAWKRSRETPDGFRLLLALASPEGVRALPDLFDKARLRQTRVTRELRRQAREAVEQFLQEVLDHPENREALARQEDSAALSRALWREGLILVYRLLFLLKLEASDDPALRFGFASTGLWRRTFSPSLALAPMARQLLDQGGETGRFLEDGLRALFQLFETGVSFPELEVKPLGGALFGAGAVPTLAPLRWGERSVALLFDRLLWTPRVRGSEARERVHYGSLEVEDLGRVYEALLELEPGIATGDMCRLRRGKLEVVVPLAQGERYRPSAGPETKDVEGNEPEAESEEENEQDEAEVGRRSRTKTTVEWIERIPAHRFFLRVGLGRKASGSYYTPDSFVRFLVRETLGPKIEERSPRDDPRPGAILRLRVLDPAMGSGHFLAEACRFLGDKLYEACRLCDDKALEAEARAEQTKDPATKERALTEALGWRQRVDDLPDPRNELVHYLPSRAPEAESAGLSQKKAEALCRRLVAVHCLYGVDNNPLAVELARLVLWLVSHAEGMPLTFLEHRLILGDSLTGPSVEHLLKFPGNQEPLKSLFSQGLREKLKTALGQALVHVQDLERSVGIDLTETLAKEAARARLERSLAPFKVLAAAWAGGVMLGEKGCDDEGYLKLVQTVAEKETPVDGIGLSERQRRMVARGLSIETAGVLEHAQELVGLVAPVGSVPALSYPLSFPEVFSPSGELGGGGFDVVLGNPPWEGLDTSDNEFYGTIDPAILDEPDSRRVAAAIATIRRDPKVCELRDWYESQVEATKRTAAALFQHVNRTVDGKSAATPDTYQSFAERGVQLLGTNGTIGLVLPSSFHANEGAAGIRRLYLDSLSIRCCFSFENRRQIFEIDSRFKFALIVAKKPGPTKSFACAFYLHDVDWLFRDDRGDRLLEYTPAFLEQTTGGSRNFLELRSVAAVPIAHAMYRSRRRSFGDIREGWSIHPTEELHTSKSRKQGRVVPLAELAQAISGDPRSPEVLASLVSQGVLPVCKGEHFHQFDASWGEAPLIGTSVERMEGKGNRVRASRYFRLVFRRQASSTNERTVIANLSLPGVLYLDSALPERDPEKRPNWRALALVGLANSLPFDWLTRQLVNANVTFNFLDTVPVPELFGALALLTHSCLRLVSIQSGYAPLWQEQLGHTWREATAPSNWPVLIGEEARWKVRAGMDALVAQSYGLNRTQYSDVLSSFSHKSYPNAPTLCLAAFDEAGRIGLEAFCKTHDPYWDIPLNESLPKPVIDLPVLDSTKRGLLPFPDSVRSRPAGASRVAEPQASSPMLAGERAHAAAHDTTWEQVLICLRTLGSVTSAELQAHLGRSAAQVRPLLQRLVSEGLAVQEGRAKGTRYIRRDGS